MRILSLDEAAITVGAVDIRAFFENVDWRYPDPVPSYWLPKDSAAQVALARVIANTFLDRGPALLWITGTGIWGSSEHMDLCSGYRLSLGENRSVNDAPVHLCAPADDRDAFMSVLCMGLFFAWDVEIMNLDRSLALTTSHDGWLEYRFSEGSGDVVSHFERWFDQEFEMKR